MRRDREARGGPVPEERLVHVADEAPVLRLERRQEAALQAELERQRAAYRFSYQFSPSLSGKFGKYPPWSEPP